jgi:L-seryl-tRNA(Ser) seleniumtransferase
MMESNKEKLRSLPSVGELLNHPGVAALCHKYGPALPTYAARKAIDWARAVVLEGGECPGRNVLVDHVAERAGTVCGGSLKPVINATGIVLHTNLGRAPLGKAVMEDMAAIVGRYCNLEFDLDRIGRGSRNTHLAELLQFLTSAEDAIVVNNNAAGIVLTLGTLAAGREVLISRGELIEIGGSFRIPDIMRTSGAVMVEVGTTNRTRLADYEAAIGPQTALIFKAHKSNYTISGFTEEVSAKELSELAGAYNVPMVYDIGSGLLRKLEGRPLENEPDVRSAIEDGADLVLFSADKLLGGPQAGIVAGRAELIQRLARAPLMRAVRVGKLTLAALTSVCRQYVNDPSLPASNPAIAMLQRPLDVTQRLAARLLSKLEEAGVEARLVDSAGQCGGGAMPGVELPSAAVEILSRERKGGREPTFAERVFRRLIETDPPVLGILREGSILLDLLTVFPDQIGPVAKCVSEAVQRECPP